MDTDDFWELIETARASAVAGRAFHEVMADLLAARTEQEILEYQEKFEEAHQALYRWDVWPGTSSAEAVQTIASWTSEPG